jgi:DNA polymerase I-like protein with 3'-5' exonuclease and polymerase domains
MVSLTLPEEGVDYDWRRVQCEQPARGVVPLAHPASPMLGQWRKVMALIARTIRDERRPLGNANVKFDCRWVYAHTGIDLSELIAWDTQVSSQLVDTEARTRLKVRAARDFGVAQWDDFDLSYPGAAEEVDLFQLGEYAARDTFWTWKLVAAAPEPDVPRRRCGGSADRRRGGADGQAGAGGHAVAMPTVRTLTRVEQRGFLLDSEWVQTAWSRRTRARGGGRAA